jgi:hypothetical protein
VTQAELESLFSAIATYLRETPLTSGAEAEPQAGFWQSRSTISRDEMIMLASLVETPRTAEVVAAVLGRDLAETQALLDGLLAVGLIEQRGRRYYTTPATEAYLEFIARDGSFEQA